MGDPAPLFLRVKVGAARALCRPVVGRAVASLTRDRVRNNGIVFDTSDPAVPPIVKAKLFWGIYESAEIRMVRRGLRGSATVVELGSSIGICAAHIAAGMPSGGKLVCVEADVRLVPILERRLREHASHLEVTVVHAAVSSAPGTVPFATSSLTTTSRVDPRATTLAPAVTLSELLADTGIHDRFSLVCDIEGAEADIILHDFAALAACDKAVFEFHDTPTATAPELRERVLALGFRVVGERGNVALLERAG